MQKDCRVSRFWRLLLLVAFAAVVLSFLVALGSVPQSAFGKDKEMKEHDPLAWTDDYTLIVTENKTIEETNEAVDLIQERGGQVAIVVSSRMLLGWAPSSVVGEQGIVAVHKKPVNHSEFAPANVDESDSVLFFNDVMSGKWRQKKADRPDLSPPHQTDMLVPSPTTPNQGVPFSDQSPAGSPGNSDFMVGKVNRNYIFVDSNGTIDPNLYTWTCADITTIKNEISAAHSFWSSRASTYGTPLTFYSYFYPTVPCGGSGKGDTSYEPILHPQSQDSLWINQIMSHFGYGTGDKFARVNAFNASQRVAAKTNWASTTFIAYNPSPAPTTFTDGYFAYAYVGGPYSQLLFRNNGWAITDFDRVNAHESGHLHGALDEYASSGCSNCFTSSAIAKNVVNGNCVNCNAGAVKCIMNYNDTVLCGYTPGQLGWGVNITSAMTAYGGVSKNNYVPGQAITYQFDVSIPGRLDEPMLADFRFWIQFPKDIQQHWDYVNFGVTSGHTWRIWITPTVPLTVAYGEASFTVQMELRYASDYFYGKGIRSSGRGKFFVLPTAANQVTTSPPVDEEPVVHVEMVK